MTSHSSNASSRGVVVMFAVVVFGLIAIFVPTSTLTAQSFYGSIVGTVTDASNAVVPAASVKVTNTGTNETHTTTSDSAGKFEFVNLVPANYRLEVTKDNFKRFVRDHIPVEVGATVRVEPAMAVGNVSETVQVTTNAPLLQTDSSTLGQTVEGARVQQMPLNGRNVMNLIALAPGVVPTGGSLGDTGLNQGTRTGGGTGWGNYQIGGAIQGQSAQYLDGVPNNVLGGNIVALVPTQDAIQEFNVATSNAGADFGRFSGGVVNMTTRSGTNSFHGGVWEYFRNKVLNANDYFSNQSGKSRVQWNQNQYGAALSGPIKSDKAFFMFTWEGFKAATGSVSTTNVPSVALQNGTFNHPITPPPGSTCNVRNNGDGTYTITNLWVGACGDPLSHVIKDYYPAPNVNGNGYNWYFAGPLGNDQNQYNARIDYSISQRQRLFGRYTYWSLHDWPAHSEFGQQGFNGTTWATNDGHVIDYTQQAVIGDTVTFNPTTVFDIRLNYVRVTSPNYPATTTQDQTVFDKYQTGSFKPYTTLAPQMSVHSLPGFGLTGSYGFYNLANFPGFSINWYNTYGINANLVKIAGSHNLKIGTELRLMDGSGSGFVNTQSGQYQYTNSSFGIGDDWAAFLMGYPTQIQFTTISSTAPYTYYQAYYVSDTWSATHNLTLNLGLRYELPGAISERKNRAFVLLPNVNDPVQAGVKGTLQLVDSSLYSDRSTVVPERDLFAPRVGMAYRVGSKMVIRGGYGISYLPNDLVSTGGTFSYNQSINSAQTIVQQNSNIAVPAQQQTLLANNFVTPGLQKPIGRTQPDIIGFQKKASTTSFLNQNISGPVPNQPYPYTQQWNFAISREFRGDMMAELSYNGLKGTNIPGTGSRNLNQLPDSFNSLGSGLATKQVCSAAGGLVVAVGQCNRPYVYYNNVQDTAGYYARENYDAFIGRFEKRMGAAGLIDANYTWSTNKGNTDTQNGFIEKKSGQQGGSGNGGIQDWNNLDGEYSHLSYDVTNRTVISYVLNLPFGNGQKYGNSMTGVGGRLISGWALNGITIFQSGFPLFFTTANGGQLGNYGAGTLRPMIVPGCNEMTGNTDSGLTRVQKGQWFNTSCFANAGAPTLANGSPNPFVGSSFYNGYGFGNEPRVDPNIRADGVKNFDMSFQKSTKIHESANLEFRAEFFNVFNRVQFAPPNSVVGSNTYGQVVYQVNSPRQIQLSARISF